MFGLTALELARIQFAFTMAFHILFPALTIGMASYLAVLELLWLVMSKQVPIVLPGLYLPLTFMLIGLIVCGIAFSFPNIVQLAPVPLLVLVAITLLLRSLRHAPHMAFSYYVFRGKVRAGEEYH